MTARHVLRDQGGPAPEGLGVAWLLSPLVQLHAWADLGLTDVSSDVLFGAGLSSLIPNRR